jgi:hypothetical protein
MGGSVSSFPFTVLDKLGFLLYVRKASLAIWRGFAVM